MGLSSPALERTCEPMDAVASWPADRPLFVLYSARDHPRWARWTILASPVETPAPLDRIELGLGDPPRVGPPYRGGWIGYLAYELGRELEPAAGGGGGTKPDDRGWPATHLAWCDDALVYDHRQRRWHAVGDPPALAPPAAKAGGFRAGALRSSLSPDSYLAAVGRTIEYIAAGDVFQVNITRRLSAPFEGSTRRLFARAMALSGARYGAYLELPSGRCLISMSPELFVDLDAPTGRVVTRPIKGTRPARRDRRELLASPKDAAELNMIVDLMRNDLGRVCALGSVRVPRARRLETHPTVHHGVGEVEGRLRSEVSFTDLLAAAFPAGSVTGAPKIRAMQIIDELEPTPRGPYCGAIGFVSPGARSVLNVAIRTIAITGTRPPGDWGRLEGTLDYGTGGGIVADSDPVAEYRESLDKAAILKLVLAREHGSRQRTAHPPSPSRAP